MRAHKQQQLWEHVRCKPANTLCGASPHAAHTAAHSLPTALFAASSSSPRVQREHERVLERARTYPATRERRQRENRITAVVQQTHRSSRRRPLGPSHKERLRQRHAHARARWCVGSGSRRTSFCRHSVFWRASIVREKVALFLSHLALRESEKPSGEAF